MPEGFTHVRQASFPDEANYQAPSDFSFFDTELMDDVERNMHIQRELLELREKKDFASMDLLGSQLKRTRCSLELPEPSTAEFATEELYAKFRPAVVVMAALGKNGQTRISSGVVIRSGKNSGFILGAAGGLEAGITALAVKHQIAPPTINLDTPDPACELDYVAHTARPMTINYALSNSFGFGGTNGTLLLKKYE